MLNATRRIKVLLFPCYRLSSVLHGNGAISPVAAHCRTLHQTRNGGVTVKNTESKKALAPANLSASSVDSNPDSAASRFLARLEEVQDVEKLLSLLLARWNGQFDSKIVDDVIRRLRHIERLAAVCSTGDTATAVASVQDIDSQRSAYSPCLEHGGVRRFVQQSVVSLDSMRLGELVPLARLYCRLAVADVFPSVWLELSRAIGTRLAADTDMHELELLRHLDHSMLLLCADDMLSCALPCRVSMALASALAEHQGAQALAELRLKLLDTVERGILPGNVLTAVTILSKLMSPVRVDSEGIDNECCLCAVADRLSGSLTAQPVSLLLCLADLSRGLDGLGRSDFLLELIGALEPELPFLCTEELVKVFTALLHCQVLDEAFCMRVIDAFRPALAGAEPSHIGAVLGGLCMVAGGSGDVMAVAAELLAELRRRASADDVAADLVPAAVASLRACLEAGLWTTSECTPLLAAAVLQCVGAAGDDEMLHACLALCCAVVGRPDWHCSSSELQSLEVVATECRRRLPSSSPDSCVRTIATLRPIAERLNVCIVNDLLDAACPVAVRDAPNLSAPEVVLLLESFASGPSAAPVEVMVALMRRLFALSDTLDFSMCMRCVGAFAGARLSDSRLLEALLRRHCDRLPTLSDRELFGFAALLSRLDFRPPWLRRALRERVASLAVTGLDLSRLYLYESLAVLSSVPREQLTLVLWDVKRGLLRSLSADQVLPVFQVLSRLYTSIGAPRAAPEHVRSRVLKSALESASACPTAAAVHSAAVRALSTTRTTMVGRIGATQLVESCVIAYPGVVLSAAVLMDKAGTIKPWQSRHFSVADDVEEELTSLGAKFLNFADLHASGLTPIGFVVLPAAACLSNRTDVVVGRAGLDLELLRRQHWICTVVLEDDWSRITSAASQAEVIRTKLQVIRTTAVDRPNNQLFQ